MMAISMAASILRVYVMSGAFNAHFQHSLSRCPRTVTDTGRQLVRVSRVLHAWF